MSFTEKNIKYADLVVPFTGCPVGEPVNDCPFISYWKIEDTVERIQQIEKVPEKELDKLRSFHRKCLKVKIDHEREVSTREYEDRQG